jgi:hypothetical protein
MLPQAGLTAGHPGSCRREQATGYEVGPNIKNLLRSPQRHVTLRLEYLVCTVASRPVLKQARPELVVLGEDLDPIDEHLR